MAQKGIRWVQVGCTFWPTDGRREFVTEDGSPVDQLLANRLDRMGIEEVEGDLVFESSAGEFKVRCLFDSYAALARRSSFYRRRRKGLRFRQFVAPGGFEATNKLSNKLERKEVRNQGGKLVFRLFPGYVKLARMHRSCRVCFRRAGKARPSDYWLNLCLTQGCTIWVLGCPLNYSSICAKRGHSVRMLADAWSTTKPACGAKLKP